MLPRRHHAGERERLHARRVSDVANDDDGSVVVVVVVVRLPVGRKRGAKHGRGEGPFGRQRVRSRPPPPPPPLYARISSESALSLVVAVPVPLLLLLSGRAAGAGRGAAAHQLLREPHLLLLRGTARSTGVVDDDERARVRDGLSRRLKSLSRRLTFPTTGGRRRRAPAFGDVYQLMTDVGG